MHSRVLYPPWDSSFCNELNICFVLSCCNSCERESFLSYSWYWQNEWVWWVWTLNPKPWWNWHTTWLQLFLLQQICIVDRFLHFLEGGWQSKAEAILIFWSRLLPNSGRGIPALQSQDLSDKIPNKFQCLKILKLTLLPFQFGGGVLVLFTWLVLSAGSRCCCLLCNGSLRFLPCATM